MHIFAETRWSRDFARQSPVAAEADYPRSSRLWIACDDATMNRAAGRIQRTPEARLLRMPGGGWTAEGGWNPLALRVVEGALQQTGLEDIVLCGHSGCSAAIDADALTGPLPDSLAQRAAQAVARNKASQRRTIEQFRSLQELPGVARRLRLGDLRLHCLYFLQESDSFLLYDETAGAFTPTERV